MYFNLDSPQVAQLYVHGSRIPHPHYPDVGGSRFFDGAGVPRPIPPAASGTVVEPPPAHRIHGPPSATYGGPPSQAPSLIPPGGNIVVIQQPTQQQIVIPPTTPTVVLPPHVLVAKPMDREREQREQRDKDRSSIPGNLSFFLFYTNFLIHSVNMAWQINNRYPSKFH